MAQENAQVIWGGSIISGNTSNHEANYVTDQNDIRRYLEATLLDVNKRPIENAKNPTDADAYVYDNGKIHVYKTKCTTKMKCKYFTDYPVKLYNDNTNIWYASFEDGKFVVSNNYNEFNAGHNEIRMPSNNGNTAGYFIFKDSGTAEYSFVESGLSATNINMFANCEDLISCEIPCEMRKIDKGTFKGCTSLTSYTVNPEFIESIGEEAFSGCTSMQTLLIPRFSNIGKKAFYGCSGATTLEWDGLNYNGVKYKMTAIPDFAFKNCYNLKYTKFGDFGSVTAITIPSGISGISANAFDGCSSITNLSLNGVEIIGAYAFQYNTNLSKINGFSSVTEVITKAFLRDVNLSIIDDTSNVKNIYPNAFDSCSALSAFNFSSCEKIQTQAFIRCSNLDNIKFNKNVEIDGGAFSSCINLKSADLSKVTKIGQSAFVKCNIQGELDLSSVTKIEDNAFNGNTGITSVKLNCNNFSATSSSFIQCSGITAVTLGANIKTVSGGDGCFSNQMDVYIENDNEVVSGLDACFSATVQITFTVPPDKVDSYRTQYSSYGNWTFEQ